MVENKVVCLSSDSEPDDPVRNEPLSRGRKRRFHCSFHCTACGTAMFGISEIHEHPWLHGVGICSDCFDNLSNSLVTKDPVDGAEKECSWCGEGGMLIICENCKKVFCYDCIIRNYGRKRGLAPILSNANWSCFCCNPELLCVHVNRLKEFRNSVSSERNFSPRSKEGRTPKTRHTRQNASDVNRGNQSQTLTELLTPNKEQNQAKEIQTRVATPCTAQRHSPKAKQHNGIEKLQQQAPVVPPARTFIRPHQMIEKRREAAERRELMAIEHLKSSVITNANLKENGTTTTQQHVDSNLQAKLEIQVEDVQLLRHVDSNLQAKLEIQDEDVQLLRHEREVLDDESKVKRNCSVM